MLRDKKYRNTVIRRLTEETKKASRPANVEKVPEEDQKFLGTLKLGFVGGCEISFMKEFLESNGAPCYHTFDHGESSDPYLTFSDKKGGVYKFNPDVVIISDAQNIRNYIKDLQVGEVDFTKQEAHLNEIKQRILASIKEARKDLNANYILVNYPIVPRPAQGMFAYKHLENAYSLREFLKKYLKLKKKQRS